MKKILLAVVTVMMTALSVNAQVKVESPHPDLDIKITRCAYASGTVVVDMVITNFGIDESIIFRDYNNNNYYNSITMYDDEGNSYNSGNSKIFLGFPNKGLEHFVSGTFPQDVPLKFRFQFGDISANASKFSIVKIALYSNGAMSLKEDQPLVIRNLEWVK